MTNGEKLCYMFPEMHYTLSDNQPRRVVTTIGVCASFDLEWWNAEYKEPTTKNDLEVDCISRADAIKGLGEQPYVWTDSDYEIQQLEDWKAHKEMLENLPSVTPQEPKTGHWIPIYQGDEIIGYRCSECEFGNTFGKGTIGMNFCPNCGSDNSGVEK